MTAAATDKPVFIDQMPDYQQAVQKIIALSQDETRLRTVAQELGVAGKLEKLKTGADSVRQQAEPLIVQEQTLNQRAEKINRQVTDRARKLSWVGDIAIAGSGIAAGVAGGKRWGVWKGVLSGAAAAVAVGAVWALTTMKILKTPSAEAAALDKDFTVLDRRKQQLAGSQVEARDAFIAQMATRMLEEQKMLEGEGAQMKLVSTAAPSASAPGMAAKYATAPAASKADAARQCGASTPQR